MEENGEIKMEKGRGGGKRTAREKASVALLLLPLPLFLLRSILNRPPLRLRTDDDAGRASVKRSTRVGPSAVVSEENKLKARAKTTATTDSTSVGNGDDGYEDKDDDEQETRGREKERTKNPEIGKTKEGRARGNEGDDISVAKRALHQLAVY